MNIIRYSIRSFFTNEYYSIIRFASKQLFVATLARRRHENHLTSSRDLNFWALNLSLAILICFAIKLFSAGSGGAQKRVKFKMSINWDIRNFASPFLPGWLHRSCKWSNPTPPPDLPSIKAAVFKTGEVCCIQHSN